MATNFRSVGKTIIFDALDGNVPGVTFYDHVPFEPEGSPDANFPYGTVGDTELVPWDNDSDLGTEVEATIHVWSRYKGRKEVDATIDVIYGLLHRASLTSAGYKVVDCLFTFSDNFVEGDGQTRHGVIRFRLTIQEI